MQKIHTGAQTLTYKKRDELMLLFILYFSRTKDKLLIGEKRQLVWATRYSTLHNNAFIMSPIFLLLHWNCTGCPVHILIY